MAKQAIEGATRGNVFYVNPFGDARYVIRIIGVDTAHKEGEHPLWDERIGNPPDVKLAANLRRYGMIDAVIARKNGVDEQGRDVLEVVDGRHRTRACRLAYEEAVAAGEEPPLLKIEVGRRSEEDHVGVMISANEHRTNDGPAVRAKKIGRLLGMGHSTESIARMFGLTAQAVETAIRFNELALPVRKAVDVGKIAYSAALELHGKSTDKQTAALEQLLSLHGNGASNGATGRGRRGGATAKAAKRIANGEEGKLHLTPAIAKKLVKDSAFLLTIQHEHEPECGRVILALLHLFAGDTTDAHVDLVDGLEDAMRRAEGP